MDQIDNRSMNANLLVTSPTKITTLINSNSGSDKFLDMVSTFIDKNLRLDCVFPELYMYDRPSNMGKTSMSYIYNVM